MKTKFIYEMPVFCGRQKEWRVLNLNTGTVYSTSYETEKEAINSIKIGEERAGGGTLLRKPAKNMDTFEEACKEYGVLWAAIKELAAKLN